MARLPRDDQIRRSVNKGLALGGEQLKQKIESRFDRRVTEASLGRPRIGEPEKGILVP